MIDHLATMSMLDLKDIRFNPMDMKSGESCSPNSIQLRTHPSHNNINFSELGKKLLESARNGDTNEVRSLINSGAPFTTDWLGASPLHYACQYGHDETVAFLLRAGIAKDARTKIERTSLHVAAQEGHYQTVSLLIEFGVDVDAKDMLKMTPLHWAVQRGHQDVVELLLSNGADVTLTNKFEKTPIDIAYNTGHIEFVSLLQSYKGINIKPKVTPAESSMGLKLSNKNNNKNRLKLMQLTPNTSKTVVNIKKEVDEAEMAIKSIKSSETKSTPSQVSSGKKDNFLANVISNGQSFALTETGRTVLNNYYAKEAAAVATATVNNVNKKANNTATPTTTSVMNNKKVSNLIVLNNPLSIDAKTVKSAAARNIHITQFPKGAADKVHIVINPAQKDEEIRKLKEQLANMEKKMEDYKSLIISKDLEIEQIKKMCKCWRKNTDIVNNIVYGNDANDAELDAAATAAHQMVD